MLMLEHLNFSVFRHPFRPGFGHHLWHRSVPIRVEHRDHGGLWPLLDRRSAELSLSPIGCQMPEKVAFNRVPSGM